MSALPSMASDMEESDMMLIFENLDRCPMIIREFINDEVTGEILTKLVKKVQLTKADYDMNQFIEEDPFSMQ